MSLDKANEIWCPLGWYLRALTRTYLPLLTRRLFLIRYLERLTTGELKMRAAVCGMPAP